MMIILAIQQQQKIIQMPQVVLLQKLFQQKMNYPVMNFLKIKK
uniref:Uncharacterized protein n=1 Tax=Meloidogyne enterolobii TaxID=390850 RepID=A0A6V7V8Z3_MELEN|nr:unnamed protein product [Meloidogyne enterolobii]